MIKKPAGEGIGQIGTQGSIRSISQGPVRAIGPKIIQTPAKSAAPKAIPTRVNRSERGQSLVEGALVLLVFLGLLFAAVDCGQVVLAHESLVERARTAIRWGVVRPWDGTGDQIANMILYNQPDEPRSSTEGYLGLTRANVQVTYRPPVPERPDDEMISVAIVNYQFQFFSPWIARTFINPRPVAISAPMAYKEMSSNAASSASLR